VAIEVTVNVARSPDEAETQARTGRAVGRFDEQEEEEEEARAAELEAQANAVFEEEVAGDAIEEPAPDESTDDEPSAEAETSPPRE
jgi:hypothetical protein